MNAHVLPVSPLFLWQLRLIREYQEAAHGFYRDLQRWPLMPDEFVRDRSDLALHAGQRDQLASLMQVVRKTAISGRYRGATMELDRTRLAAEMSGDWNDVHVNPDRPHPLFGKLIAHGMDAVTQAFAAIRSELGDQPLAPREASIAFVQPVFLGEDQLSIHVAPKTPLEWDVAVSARGSNVAAERIVVRLHLSLQDGRPFADDDWFRALMAIWRISALLAKTWPGCLYTRQELRFHQPMAGDALGIAVQGIGRNDRGHSLVRTEAHEPRRSLLPFITGRATIVLPRAA